MRNLELDLLNKFEMIELKKEVISILHSLHYDRCYHIEDCIIDLHKLLSTLDEMEIPQKNLMNINRESLTKDALTKHLNEDNKLPA